MNPKPLSGDRKKKKEGDSNSIWITLLKNPNPKEIGRSEEGFPTAVTTASHGMEHPLPVCLRTGREAKEQKRKEWIRSFQI